VIDIKEYIKGEVNTESIQAAIDYAAENRKVLLFSKGVYTVTSLELRSNSSVYVDKEAVISATTNSDEWTKHPLKPVIYCENAENVCIRGGGTITANGYAYVDEKGYRKLTENKPESVIVFRKVSNAFIENLILKETVGWTLQLDDCDDVLVDGIIIRNPTYVTRKNSDGIDINGCRNVTIMNCDIETGDDAICLKNVDYKPGADDYKSKHSPSNNTRRDMYNIHVYNCVCASTCNSTKIGTETVGNIYDVTFEKIKVKKHSMVENEGAGNPPYDSYHALSAISVQSNDGAVVKNIKFKDYHVEEVDAPVFILYQQRDRFVSTIQNGEISNISIENIYVERSYRSSQILSSHKGKIRGIYMDQVHVRTYEEKSDEYIYSLPDGKKYPDVYSYGRFPAYGLFSRNAQEIGIKESVFFYDESESGRMPVDIG